MSVIRHFLLGEKKGNLFVSIFAFISTCCVWREQTMSSKPFWDMICIIYICIYYFFFKLRRALLKKLSNLDCWYTVVWMVYRIYRQMLCFLFVSAFEYKIYCLMLYHLLKSTLHSKANACNIGTFIRFYIQMRVQIKNKAFAYRFYRPFTQQCSS